MGIKNKQIKNLYKIKSYDTKKFVYKLFKYSELAKVSDDINIDEILCHIKTNDYFIILNKTSLRSKISNLEFDSKQYKIILLHLGTFYTGYVSISNHHFYDIFERIL